jgi:hypothetical protein
MGNAAGGAPRFTVRGVISASLSLVYANIGRFLVIFLAIGLPAALLIGATVMMLTTVSRSTASPGIDFTLKGDKTSQVLFMSFLALLILVAYSLIQAAITDGAWQNLRGRKLRIGAALSGAVTVLPRVALAGLVFSVALVVVISIPVALLQIVLPAAVGAVTGLVMLAIVAVAIVRYWVFVPVVVIERAGPLACFRRSAALSRGHRWEILGILALVMLANWLVSLAAHLLPGIGAPAAGAALEIAAALFFTALSAVLATVAYYLLRAEKDGPVEDAATVFD